MIFDWFWEIFEKNSCIMKNMRKTRQNSCHLFFMNLPHWRHSKFSKRETTQNSIQNYAASKRMALPVWTWYDKASPPTDLGNYQQDKTSSAAAEYYSLSLYKRSLSSTSYLTPAVNRQPGHRPGNSPSFQQNISEWIFNHHTSPVECPARLSHAWTCIYICLSIIQ